MVTIYTRESYGQKEMVDIGGIFMNLYQIEWYPSFLIIDNNDYKFISKMSSRELLECLNKEL